MNQERQLIAQCHSGYNNIAIKNNDHLRSIQLTIPKVPLNPGIYIINVIIFDKTNQKYLAWYPEVKRFRVVGEFVGGANIQLTSDWKIS